MNELTIYIASLEGDGLNRELKSAVNITDVSEIVMARFSHFQELTPGMNVTTGSGKIWEILFPYIDWDKSIINGIEEGGKPVEVFESVPIQNHPHSIQMVTLDNRSKFIALVGRWVNTALTYKNWPEKPPTTHVIRIKKSCEAIGFSARHLFAGMGTISKNMLLELDITLFPKDEFKNEFLNYDILASNYQRHYTPQYLPQSQTGGYGAVTTNNTPSIHNGAFGTPPPPTLGEKVVAEATKFHSLLEDTTFLSVNNVAKWMDIDFKNYILYLDPVKMLNIIRTKCGINIELVGEDAAIESLTRVLSDGHDFHAVREQGGNLIRWQRKFRDGDDNIIESAAEYLKLGCDYRKAEREKWFADYESKNAGNPPKERKSSGQYGDILKNLIGE